VEERGIFRRTPSFIVELDPPLKPSFESWFPHQKFLKPFDAVNLTDSPMGVPHVHSLAAGSLLQSRLKVPCLCNLRVGGLGRVEVKSMVLTAAALGLKWLVFTRGDKSEGLLSVVEALDEVEEVRRLGGVHIGVVCGKPVSLKLVEEKLARGAEFIVADSNLGLGELRELARIVTRFSAKLVAGLSLKEDSEDLQERVRRLENLVDGFCLMWVEDLKKAAEVAWMLRELVGRK